MSAALRVWWTFFTALRLQRWLGGVGLVLCLLLTLGGLAAEQPLWIAGLSALFILAVFPTLFASPAVFRALSAARANQMLPHFRARMLGAVALLIATPPAIVAALILGVPTSANPPAPAFAIIVIALAFATAMFLIMFLQFGDWRWIWLWSGTSLGLPALALWPSVRGVLAAIPSWGWFGAVLVAWTTFGAWYLRARHIRPLVLVPQPSAGPWARAKLEGPITREAALHALITATPPGQPALDAKGVVIAVVILAALSVAFVTPAARFLHVTSFVWPFIFMLGSWGLATSVVHRSRLLWLRIPGPRDAVRRAIERALLHNLGRFLLALLALAALYASPLVAAPPHEVVAGFALAAGAALFGTYAAFAGVPAGALQITAFALVMALQLALLTRPVPSPTSVVLVTAAELLCALFFRALALRRWRRVDWLRVRPLPASLLRAR